MSAPGPSIEDMERSAWFDAALGFAASERFAASAHPLRRQAAEFVRWAESIYRDNDHSQIVRVIFARLELEDSPALAALSLTIDEEPFNGSRVIATAQWMGAYFRRGEQP